MNKAIDGLCASAVRRFKAYPAYKDSGVEWLGDIPAHWFAKRLKFAAPARISKLDAKPDEAVYVGLEHVESWTGRLLLDSQPESVDSVVALFKAGDVLFGKLRPYLAKAARPDFVGVCTSEILPLRPAAECSQSYVMYCLLNAPYIRWLDSLTYGTKMPRVSPEQVGSSFFPVPPEPEQRAIAAFLDRETARIDALVANKERLIELLQEKRTALITHAITKGLDPTVLMKDSGVEWLGEIPVHWAVVRVKGITAEHKQGFYTEQAYVDEGVKLARITDIDDHAVVSFANMPFVQISERSELEFRIRQGDFLFARSGTIGRFGVVRHAERAVFASYLIRFRFKEINIEFLRYAFASQHFRESLISSLHGGANQNVHAENIKERWIAVPPLTEQGIVAAFLEQETAKIDALIVKVREAIDRLKEFRTALISAAVTGKIDVREQAA